MVRSFHASILVAKCLAAALGLAVALAGCSPGPILDRLPADMALPAGAPARPTAPYQYPAVHDMPPPRPTTTMSEDEQFKLEKELGAARDRQETQEGQSAKKNQSGQSAQSAQAKAPKNVAPLTKKQPSSAIVVPPAGVKTNP